MNSALSIFLFRKLADAKWHIMGYKSDGHEAPCELIASAEVASAFRLQDFDRFRKIRNGASYDGKTIACAKTPKEETAKQKVFIAILND